MNRRDIVKFAVGAAATGMAGAGLYARGSSTAWAQAPGAKAAAQTAPASKAPAFVQQPLGYAYEALEPHIDTTTMRIHYGTHHAAYVRNLNALVEQSPALASTPMEKTLTAINSVPVKIREGVRNNMGGHWNHSFFWDLMTPGGTKAPSGNLKAAIDGAFGSQSAMQEAVDKAALSRFGSGWAWLGVDRNRKLMVFSTPYQDTPHMVAGTRGAVIGVDVWEHAYYLKHQASRANYLKAWWNTVNWDKAAARFATATA